MKRNALGKCPNNNVLSWTNLAKECYKIGMACYKCSLPEDIKKECKMKPTVIELVKKFGRPK